MREPPRGLLDGEVLMIVRRRWSVEVDEVEHLPVGFGAHHWRASMRGEPRLFVTLDALGDRHSADSLEAAYAAAAALDLDVVVASLPTHTGGYTVPLEHGRLSCAPWTAGEVAGSGPVADERLARANIEAGYADHLRPDWAMVELYDLEWRLDEIAQYASWFSRPHSGSRDDQVAWDGLQHELDRPERHSPP